MIDGSYLKGACVRDKVGSRGRLVSIEDTSVIVGWETHTSSLREETLDKTSDRYRYGVEVLTLDRGWAPLSDILPSPTPGERIVSEMRHILEQNHNPFQNKAKLGPGPRGGTNQRRNRWSCSGSGYDQVCVGIAEDNNGQILRIRIDPEYKAQYNREYKRWRRNVESD